MKIRHLFIKRFRGIKSLNWKVDKDFICLIGPGDSTKSTILDAIELALYPWWHRSFDDSDFYNCDTSKPFIITVSVCDLPEKLLKDSKFGLELQGWNQAEGLKDEPEDGDEKILTIRLSVSSSLEPEWTVVNSRNPDGKRISSNDRGLFAMAKLGFNVDKHLSWNRGTVLSRLSGNIDELPVLLAETARKARLDFDIGDMAGFLEVVRGIEKTAKPFGVSAQNGYKSDLDTSAVNLSFGGISLHDGLIPMRRAGLGTKRLLITALQRTASEESGITLIDEIEYGLEPHRIIRLIQALRSIEKKQSGQTILTSHSPVVVCEMDAEELGIVRSKNGNTIISSVSSQLQRLVRGKYTAFLGKKILVCEGKTEVGVCRAMDNYWSETLRKETLAFHGVVLVDGNGDEAPSYAKKFSELGYATALFADSDVELNPDTDQLRKMGVNVVQWDERCSTEERIFNDFPWNCVLEVFKRMNNSETVNFQSIIDSIRHDLPDAFIISDDPVEWIDSKDLRAAIGKASKRNGWFKRIDFGEKLTNLLIKHLDTIPQSDFYMKLASIREWIDSDD
jgi:putative ATP-dependent endonuclease of the OLD family